MLAGVVASQPDGGRLTEARLRLALGHLLGADLAGGCRVNLQGTTLTVSAEPALATQLQRDAAELVRLLNQAVGGVGTVHRLTVKIARGGVGDPAER